MNSLDQALDRERRRLSAKVQRRLGKSPLWEVAHALEDTIHDRAVGVGDLKKFIQRTLDALPSSFGPRFAFDAAMIQSIADAWSSQALQLSQMIVPVFGKGKDYAYSRQPMHPGHLTTHFVELVHLPGGEDLGDVNLLSYPWLCHELGHLVLCHPESTFLDDFDAALQVALSGMVNIPQRKSSQPDTGAVREIYTCWAPARDPEHPEDWANECAADVVALWTCGPAFVTLMENTAANRRLNPYSIEAPHPPYEVRLRAVVAAARLLGWRQAVSRLGAIADQWQEGRQKAHLVPNYAYLTHPVLIESGVWAAIDACRALRLPLCTRAVVDGVRTRISANLQPSFGVELLLAARLIRDEKGPKAYKTWERDTVIALAKQVTLEYP